MFACVQPDLLVTNVKLVSITSIPTMCGTGYYTIAYCDPPCPYGGSCDTDTLTCNCSTVTIGQ